jgi:copper/silver efflux system protein
MRNDTSPIREAMMHRFIMACLKNPLLVGLFGILVVCGGLAFAPFDWHLPLLPRAPIAVDAIPDIGENQQIIFTEWPGRAPQDVEDQITYRLTATLLGMPGVKAVRGLSMFGFSTIYVIFNEEVEFYWSRSRILEKLNSLPRGTLPEGVSPALGPDATALGQVFWYTLEGRDPAGEPTGGWDLSELRSIQDWIVKDALLSARQPGKSSLIAEVSSIGGFVKEYQVDVDADAMRAYGTSLAEILSAVKSCNLDVGARSLEVNRVEYLIRGVGSIASSDDIRNAVVKQSPDGVPVYLHNVANVTLGPALRRGALDKAGTETVGGVVVVRFGENPLEAIQDVKRKIAEIAPGLPRKTLPDGTTSQVRIVPFYDRTQLIHETLSTLNTALTDEILVTILVVLALLLHLRSSLLISSLLPLSVLMCFIAMRLFHVDANIVALSGIAIAIGTMVDMGIVISENIHRHLSKTPNTTSEAVTATVGRATSEVGSAVLTAVATTIVSFLPVFMMTGAEGKLFRPLAFTKTFALVASLIVSLVILPTAARILYNRKQAPTRHSRFNRWRLLVVALIILVVLSHHWLPLGITKGTLLNLLFVGALVGVPLIGIRLFLRSYHHILAWCLAHKLAFLSLPLAILIAGAVGSRSLGKEFMPSLDEGSYLYMPSTSPHASIGEVLEIIHIQDAAISQIPEVETVVGKLGRVDSALDPAPLGMIETIITYKAEYAKDGDGKPRRQWRDHIRTPNDIWDEILKAAHMPGITKPEKLQPISTRLLMLQSGIRGSMAIKIKGPTQQAIEETSVAIQTSLRTADIEGLDASLVNVDRSTGNRKPYLEIIPDRAAIGRYGVQMQQVQSTIATAIGGTHATAAIEGRERYSVRVRYLREHRDSIEALGGILVATPNGAHVPLRQLADIRFVAGPQVIKTEDASQVGYVFFGKREGHAEVNVVDSVSAFLDDAIATGQITLPDAVSYTFTGTYENQVRAQRTLSWVLPFSLLLIFVILYLQFRSTSTSLLVFSGVAVAWAGGFIMLWLYGQSWFMDVSLFGIHLRELFQVHPINLSVAVWVGFLALFGIATDDGVVMATYLTQRFRDAAPATPAAIRATVLEAGNHRIRACLMTTATTVLALLPVLTSTGRGSDVMVPMAIPSFGGMLIEVITMLVVPVLYCWIQESRLRRRFRKTSRER